MDLAAFHFFSPLFWGTGARPDILQRVLDQLVEWHLSSLGQARQAMCFHRADSSSLNKNLIIYA